MKCSIEVFELRPGDILVVRAEGVLAETTVEAIRRILPDEVKVLALEPGVDLAVLRGGT